MIKTATCVEVLNVEELLVVDIVLPTIPFGTSAESCESSSSTAQSSVLTSRFEFCRLGSRPQIVFAEPDATLQMAFNNPTPTQNPVV